MQKKPEKEVHRVISTTVENYLDYVLEKSSAYLHKVIIQGIPCPNVDRATFENQEIEESTNEIQQIAPGESIFIAAPAEGVSEISNINEGITENISPELSEFAGRPNEQIEDSQSSKGVSGLSWIPCALSNPFKQCGERSRINAARM